MAGVTPDGFEKKTVQTIREELVQDAQAIWGSALNLEPSTPDGIFIDQMSEGLGDIWDIAEETYNAFFPGQATGTTLSQLVEINNITRKDNEPTHVTLTFNGVSGHIVPIGTEVTNVANSITVSTVEDLVLTGSDDEVIANNIVDGAIEIPIGTMTVLVSADPDITSVTNDAVGILGSSLETDPQLRSRRVASIPESTAVTDSITADVVNLKGVTHVKTYENDTATPSFIPPNSVMAVVNGGDPTEIAVAINKNRPLGIPTQGDISVIIEDNQGIEKTINFQRPTGVPIYVTVNLTIIDSNEYEGDASIIDNIMKYVDSVTEFNVGDDVYQSRLYTPINNVPGHVIDSLFIGISPNPTDPLTIPISFQEISDWDASRIVVNS